MTTSNVISRIRLPTCKPFFSTDVLVWLWTDSLKDGGNRSLSWLLRLFSSAFSLFFASASNFLRITSSQSLSYTRRSFVWFFFPLLCFLLCTFITWSFLMPVLKSTRLVLFYWIPVLALFCPPFNSSWCVRNTFCSSRTSCSVQSLLTRLWLWHRFGIPQLLWSL